MIMIFLFFAFLSLFGVGILIILIGVFRKPRFNRITKTGIIVFSLPIGFIVLAFGYELFHGLFSSKPSEQELVGTYQISEDFGLLKGYDRSKFKLILKEDNTFELTPTPMISICEKGKYELDYKFNLNELTFRCDNNLNPAHLNREFGSFTIEFIIGDPDSGQSIHFRKIK